MAITVREFFSALAKGPYTSIGGYPIYFLVDDGESICFDCAKSNVARIGRAIRDGDRGGWKVVSVDVNWESDDVCAHCGKAIEMAYPPEGGESC